jgi:hypothetical protein
MAREQQGSPGRDGRTVKLLGIKAWKTEAKDRKFWRQRIEEAKAQYGL